MCLVEEQKVLVRLDDWHINSYGGYINPQFPINSFILPAITIVSDITPAHGKEVLHAMGYEW